MKILWEFESRISPPTIEVRNTHVCGQSINCPLLSTNEEEENPSSLPSHVVTFKAPGIRTFHAIRTRRIQDSGGGEITLENTLCFLSRVPAISGHFRGSTKKREPQRSIAAIFFHGMEVANPGRIPARASLKLPRIMNMGSHH